MQKGHMQFFHILIISQPTLEISGGCMTFRQMGFRLLILATCQIGSALQAAFAGVTVTNFRECNLEVLSSDGQVAAGEILAAGIKRRQHACRWFNGTATDLGTLGGASSVATAISADGSVVVGSSYTVSGDTHVPNELHAFRWVSGSIADLGTLGGTYSEAIATSDSGTVVAGASRTESGQTHAFLWTTRWFGLVKGSMIDLGTLGGNYSTAFALSADGKVVAGDSFLDGNRITHAFRWTNGSMADLGTLGGNYSHATAISADGAVVVGTSYTSDGSEHAFRWESGHMSDLGTLGGPYSVATTVSADGSVVAGDSKPFPDPYDIHAFRWANGIMTDLGTLGGRFSHTVAISSDGMVIVGNAKTDNSDGEIGFRWTQTTGMQSLAQWLFTVSIRPPDGAVLSEIRAVDRNGSALIGSHASPCCNMDSWIAATH